MKVMFGFSFASILFVTIFCDSVVSQNTGEDTITSLPDKFDLPTAKSLALQHNPSLHALRAQLQESDGRLRELRSSSRPQLTADSDYMGYDDNRLQFFGSDTMPDSSRWSAAAEASMPLYAGGRNRQAIRSALAVRRAVETDLEAAKETLLVDVEAAYLDALLAQQNAEVQRQSISVLEQQLVRAKKRFNSGVGARFDVLQAEVAVANEKPPAIRAENDYRRFVDRLSRMIGLSLPVGLSPDQLTLHPVNDEISVGLEMQEALRKAVDQRPELRSLMHRIEAERRQVDLANRQDLPFVEMFAEYGIESDQFGGDDLFGWTSGLRMSWTLGDGGRAKGQAQQASSRIVQLTHQVAELTLSISGEVREAYYDYHEARAIHKSANLVIQQADEAVRLASNRFSVGRGTQLDVLESQLQLTRARLDAFTAMHDMHLAVARIRRAVGHGSQ